MFSGISNVVWCQFSCHVTGLVLIFTLTLSMLMNKLVMLNSFCFMPAKDESKVPLAFWPFGTKVLCLCITC